MAMLLLALGARPLPTHAASSLLSLIPDAQLLPPSPSAPAPPWSIEEGPAIGACERFGILPPDAPRAPCHGPLMALGGEPESSGTRALAAEPEVEKKPPGTPHQSFHVTNEGWFGRTTYAGGADKTSHLVDFYIISKELSFLYNTLGYSRTQSIWLGLGVTLLGGLTNEFGDGFNRYGFSYQDFVMDAAGATMAALVSSLGAHDLIGFRRGFLLPPYSDPPGCCPGDHVGQAYQSRSSRRTSSWPAPPAGSI